MCDDATDTTTTATTTAATTATTAVKMTVVDCDDDAMDTKIQV
jgi:hypothetical protein